MEYLLLINALFVLAIVEVLILKNLLAEGGFSRRLYTPLSDEQPVDIFDNIKVLEVRIKPNFWGPRDYELKYQDMESGDIHHLVRKEFSVFIYPSMDKASEEQNSILHKLVRRLEGKVMTSQLQKKRKSN